MDSAAALPIMHSASSQWRIFFGVTFVLPVLAVSLPPLLYPHLSAFILPLAAWMVLCYLLLHVSAACHRISQRSSAAKPSLTFEAPHATQSLSTAPTTPRSWSVGSGRGGRYNVVTLNSLEQALELQPAASVLTALYTTSDLLTSVGATEDVSFAIISYRQVRSNRDDFTLDVDAFVSAISKAREAGVDAIWLDGWCYRQEGAYNHAAFCAELGQVMRHVSACVWLPCSRAGAEPSYQFRLWCTFEASVVAERRLPVFVAGKGLSFSQVAMTHLGIFFFALPGLSLPDEVKKLAYTNTILLFLSICFPLCAPFAVILVASGTWAQLLPFYGLEAAYARNGRYVLLAMAEGITRAKLGASAGSSGSARNLSGSSIRSRLHSSARNLSGSIKRFNARMSSLDNGSIAQAQPQAEPPATAAPRNTKWSQVSLASTFVGRGAALARPPSPIRPMTRRLRKSLTSKWTREETKLMRSQRSMLAWLPAYDRRDALVVRTLLDMLSTELTLNGQLSPAAQLAGQEAMCALAASCYTAAQLTPSSGDDVGALDVNGWLEQKSITLPMTSPIRLSLLCELDWSAHRGYPDQLTNPAGRLRVPSPPTISHEAGAEWVATAPERVREIPLAWQMTNHLFFGAAVPAIFITMYITLAVDFDPDADPDATIGQSGHNFTSEATPENQLFYTTAGCAFTGAFAAVCVTLLMTAYHIRYMWANYPAIVHGPSFAAILGGFGYNALQEYVAYAIFAVAAASFALAPLLILDTGCFTRSGALFFTANVYSAHLMDERHAQNPFAARVAYVSLLVMMQLWQVHFAIDASWTTWHMWHRGWRSGHGFYLNSNITRDRAVVRFAAADAPENVSLADKKGPARLGLNTCALCAIDEKGAV